MIIGDDRQRPESLRLEALHRSFACSLMQALIGNFDEPLAHLPVDIMQIVKLPQRPEALAEIADGTLHLAFGKGRQLHRVTTVRISVSA
jgi:hypothetical protein